MSGHPVTHRLRSVVQLQPFLWFADCECMIPALGGAEADVLATIGTHLDVVAAQATEQCRQRHPSQREGS